MKLKKLVPMLNVSNIEKSLEFYEQCFGFKVVSDPKSVNEWRWATIKCGDVELMLSETDNPANLEKSNDPHKDVNWPSIYYFYPDNVAELYDCVIRKGFTPTALETTFYGMKEFSIQDPDGHLLSFGQDVDKAQN